MSSLTLDTLGYSKKLIQLGFTQQQAEGFAELARQKEDADKKSFETFKAYVQVKIDAKDEALRKELATKGDLTLEIEKVKASVREAELRLQKEIESVKASVKETETRLLKWQIAIGFTIVSAMSAVFWVMINIMAKGLGWIGF